MMKISFDTESRPVVATIPPVVFPKVERYGTLSTYILRVSKTIHSWQFLSPAEQDRCERLGRQINEAQKMEKRYDLYKMGVSTLGNGIILVGGSYVYEQISGESIPSDHTVLPLSFVVYLTLRGVLDAFFPHSESDELRQMYKEYCIWLPESRLAKEATKAYESSTAQQDLGQFVEETLLPVIVVGGFVFGAMKAVETGDTSTLQRAWAMVR